MSRHATLRVMELTPSRNWPRGKVPSWVDPRSRLYTGLSIMCCGREWNEIVAAFDGRATHAWLTENGFDLDRHGPEIAYDGCGIPKYRKVVRDWMLDTYEMEVLFT